MKQKIKKIVCIFGTRPEAIKMAPVVKELYQAKAKGYALEIYVCVTAQHREMLDQVLRLFDIQPDYDLNIMRQNQDLFSLTSNIIQNIGSILSSIAPDLVLVHGDTTTTFVAALSSYYLKTKIGHVEAGLRTNNKYYPFPEEINRRLTGVLTDYHFCPTESAKNNLVAEGVKEDNILVTGNTVIDALEFTLNKIRSNRKRAEKIEQQFSYLNSLKSEKKLILVTGHRRENFGEGLANICQALKSIVAQNHQVEIVFPVHPNPKVKEPVHNILGHVKGIWLIEPLDYEPFVYLMDKSYLILTDSGGIQEEAPSLGKPVLVMRDVTERPEAVAAGVVQLVGTNPQKISEKALLLVKNEDEYQKMSKTCSPYGDGKAARRIVDFIIREI